MSAAPDTAILASRVRLPEHVAHRSFGDETVVVNLRSGKYHGLNRTALRMLEVLTESPSVGDAVPLLADELGADTARVEADVLDLCRGLAERGLVELE
jgi:Coenzyme PQQ synthesis protein D (PqqD)